MTIQAKHLDLPQGRIRYRDTGAGEPIVFVHGLLVDGAAVAGRRCRAWRATSA